MLLVGVNKEGLPIGFVLTKFAPFEEYLWFNLEYNAR